MLLCGGVGVAGGDLEPGDAQAGREEVAQRLWETQVLEAWACEECTCEWVEWVSRPWSLAFDAQYELSEGGQR